MSQNKLKIAFLVNMPLCNVSGGAEMVISELLSRIDLNKFEITLVVEHPLVHEKYLSYFKNKVHILSIYNYWCGYYKREIRDSHSSLRWKYFPPSGLIRHLVKSFVFKRKLVYIAMKFDAIVETDTFYFIKQLSSYNIKPRAKIIGWHHTDYQQFKNVTQEIKNGMTNPLLMMDSVFFVSQYIKTQAMNYICQVNPALIGQVFYTPNGIDVAKIKHIEKFNVEVLDGFESNLLNSDYILMVARVAASKGHTFAISAFAEISEQLPELKLVFVGATGGTINELRNQIAVLGLQDKIIFLGAKSNPYAWMKNCRLALLCSQYSESFGLVVLEYMVFNRPIIVSNIPQLIDAFDDSVNYFSSQDSHSLALKMLEMLSAEVMIDIADKYKHVLDKYSISNATHCFENLLLQVIKHEDAANITK